MKFNVVLPILGFEDEKEFELEQISDIFYTLKGKKVNFAMLNPFAFKKDYDFEISDAEQEKLKLNDKTKFLVLNILTVSNPFENSTFNLAAPVIFNLDENVMGQVVLDKYDYSLNEPLKKYVKEEKESN
jgi:flagellar assembly factor FliW